MKRYFISLALLFLPLAALGQASPYSNVVFPAQTFISSAQTGSTILLNGLIVPSTVGSSFNVGTITLTGNALTTVSFSVYGSADNGVSFYPLIINPGTSTAVTATSNGLYQINLIGITELKFVTLGTFTATNISLTLTATPNGAISQSITFGGTLPTASGAGQGLVSTGAGSTYTAQPVAVLSNPTTFTAALVAPTFNGFVTETPASVSTPTLPQIICTGSIGISGTVASVNTFTVGSLSCPGAISGDKLIYVAHSSFFSIVGWQASTNGILAVQCTVGSGAITCIAENNTSGPLTIGAGASFDAMVIR